MNKAQYYSNKKLINWITVLLIIFLILSNIAASIEGKKFFEKLIANYECTSEFERALDQEKRALKYSIECTDKTHYELLLQAIDGTRAAINKLPNNYHSMSVQRGEITKDILSSYSYIQDYENALINMGIPKKDFINEYNELYELLEKLDEKSERLEVITSSETDAQYKNKYGIAVIAPTICVIAGIVIIFIFVIFRNSIEKSYYITIQEKHMIEKQLAQTRYEMLKNQINPHFLFNTLNLIAGTAEIEEAYVTEKMIITLSRLFRYNLKSQTAFMPLEQELKVIDDYMYLQKMRFGQRIKYSCNASKDTLDIPIPSFVLQPLVENAIIHGISGSSGGGMIFVRTWRDNDLLWISVADTGKGIPIEKCDYLNQKINSVMGHNMDSEIFYASNYANNHNINESDNRAKEYEDVDKGTGIGLSNIAERLHTISKDSGLRIYSRYGHGTTVQIYIKKK